MASSSKRLPAPDRVVDTSGERCPYPVVVARRELADMRPGEHLLIISTDAHAHLDFEAFCARTGHDLIDAKSTDTPYHFLLRARPVE